ncbi:MAG: Hsp20 family protein [Rhodospirillaceae bacterium]
MRNLDLTPLFRSSVGFDNLTRMLDVTNRCERSHASYPPYNIIKCSTDDYRITFAVAGLSHDDIELVIENNTLTVKGTVSHDNDEATYLHRGIAGRSFVHRFQLAEHIQVIKATMMDGLLHVDLKREVPESLRPRTIPISSANGPQQLNGEPDKKAA